ncbi:MAG: hypothetical protein Q8Q80_04320 [Methyloversatilis sp.]|uniref:hypothetical protein n=1 Tax=Methyloversatilis sp. TaxID=2569862 RepID=UPI002735F3F4|nr:hypothetical protein [Methyloversatilis sp.]MDP3871867.1 hypothetical protein [Methyloversatilis sp.]
MKDWLQPLEHPGDIVRRLHQSGLCQRFAADALLLLNAVMTDAHGLPRELAQRLDEIVRAASELEQDTRYQRLREYVRRRSN